MTTANLQHKWALRIFEIVLLDSSWTLTNNKTCSNLYLLCFLCCFFLLNWVHSIDTGFTLHTIPDNVLSERFLWCSFIQFEKAGHSISCWNSPSVYNTNKSLNFCFTLHFVLHNLFMNWLKSYTLLPPNSHCQFKLWRIRLTKSRWALWIFLGPDG